MKKTTLDLHLSSRSIYGGLFLVYCSPFILMRRCPIVFFVDFCICFFINPSVSTGRVLRKPILIALRMLVVFGLKIVEWKYCASSGLFVWARILFTKTNYCVSMGTSHVPVCLLPVHFIICFPFLVDCHFVLI